MKFNIDSFYTDGKLHKHRGEDYAMHGEDFFIICDGCSSAENSDITARLQAHIAKKYINTLRYTDDFELVAFCIGNDLYRIMDEINSISYKSMPLATLMIGCINKDELRILIYGDGCVLVKRKDEKQEIWNISYNTNAPYYPYYYTSNDHFKDYKVNYPEAFQKLTDENAEEKHDFMFPFNNPYHSVLNIDNLEYLYMFSDGIEEFSNQNNKIDIKDTVKSFTDMKNTNGAFIQRRCIRQLKTYEKDNIFPMDDFSMAGVNFNA